MKITELKHKMKSYRKEYAMETKEFADLSGIPHQQIKNYESGILNPKSAALKKICKFMELDQDTTDGLLLQVMRKSYRIELLVSDFLSNKLTIEQIASRVECSEDFVIKTINKSDKNHLKIQVRRKKVKPEKIEYPGSGLSIQHNDKTGTIGNWDNMTDDERAPYMVTKRPF